MTAKLCVPVGSLLQVSDREWGDQEILLRVRQRTQRKCGKWSRRRDVEYVLEVDQQAHMFLSSEKGAI